MKLNQLRIPLSIVTILLSACKGEETPPPQQGGYPQGQPAGYGYVDLGTENVFTGNIFGGAVPFTIDDKTTFHLVRAGVNWKF